MFLLIQLRTLCLILAFYALRTRATPAFATMHTVHQAVSIFDLVGDDPEVLQTGDVIYQYSLPEPDWSDSYMEGGMTYYRYPAGVKVPPGYWEERGINATPPAVQGPLRCVRDGSDLDTRCFIPCLCESDCGSRSITYTWQTSSYSAVVGNTYAISDPLCPPGSITKSYTYSYTWSVQIQTGPDLKFKFTPDIIDKVAAKLGVSYTLGHATATGYTVTIADPTLKFPFIEAFRPNIMNMSGIGQQIIHDYTGGLCSTSAPSQMSLQIPIVQGNNNDCKDPSSSCGADGVYDSCFFTGGYAAVLCPNSDLGNPPTTKLCPSYLYPSQWQ